ncbi:hypothetical protein SORBI_3007G090442 [Sorghum bicolor]|uniref:Uncharacterized protein n=1 Tax=Sorghum bicolor TaxID=4558 RepID=A0A1Z5R8S8_SORBI|nr:hypothetical protein SORBI_3007G090442 [Sorghum bicolor]
MASSSLEKRSAGTSCRAPSWGNRVGFDATVERGRVPLVRWNGSETAATRPLGHARPANTQGRGRGVSTDAGWKRRHRSRGIAVSRYGWPLEAHVTERNEFERKSDLSSSESSGEIMIKKSFIWWNMGIRARGLYTCYWVYSFTTR